MARIREIVARGRRAPQTVIANGDNEGQWLKRDMRAVEIRSFRGYFFTREWSKFCWVRFERFHPGFNFPATGHRHNYVCRGGPFVQIIPSGPLAVLNGCNVGVERDRRSRAGPL